MNHINMQLQADKCYEGDARREPGAAGASRARPWLLARASPAHTLSTQGVRTAPQPHLGPPGEELPGRSEIWETICNLSRLLHLKKSLMNQKLGKHFSPPPRIPLVWLTGRSPHALRSGFPAESEAGFSLTRTLKF